MMKIDIIVILNGPFLENTKTLCLTYGLRPVQ